MQKLAVYIKIIKNCFCLFLCSGIISIALIFEPLVRIKNFSTLKTENLQTTVNCSAYFSNKLKMENHYTYVAYDQIPKHVIDAFTSIEDSRFFEHEGIDFYRIFGAILKNIKSKSYKQGASTITQQLIKNTHLSSSKNLKRKISEIRLARHIERKFSKEKIFELYLNKIYFGNNIYGIGNAAKKYFNKDILEITISEGATLAAIINNPTKYNPLINYEKTVLRRNTVLYQMKLKNKITNKIYIEQKNTPLNILYTPNNEIYNIVINEASKILDCSINQVLYGNYKIYTTLDFNLQNNSQEIYNYVKYNNLNNENISIITSNTNGEILFIFNHGNANPLSTKRQPASTIKPFLSYTPAIENNSLLPLTPILDEKTDFSGYSPKNYKNRYLGWASAKDCLIYSQNIPAVKLLISNGIENSKKFASKFGLTFSQNDNSLSIALGGLNQGFTLNQINTAYNVFSRDGIYKENYLIEKIEHNNKVLYTHKGIEHRIIKSETAYFINDMLKECAKSGTAKKLKNIDCEIAAKTGTAGNTNGNTDAYCIAYTPQYTISSWIGNKTTLLPNHITGGNTCTDLVDITLSMLDINSEIKFNKPKYIVELDIDKKEYINNHKITLALGAKKIDTIKAEFSITNLPLSYKYYLSNYILYMNDNVFNENTTQLTS